jgi:putative hydrolase of the HAD superfamily
MQHIQAIGFDLFDTLVTVEQSSRHQAPERLLKSLQAEGVPVTADTFMPVYREVAQEYMRAARADGKETYNRVWISTALERLGYAIAPDDVRITRMVEAYFSAFLDHAEVLPDTLAMLAALQGRYRLGLLSNLTHAPAARQIMDHLGLTAFFEVVLISGDLGYRKPHPQVFQHLAEQFAVPRGTIAFVGDDVEADIHGAQQAGFQPIWTTYTRSRPGAPGSAQPAPTPPGVPAIRSWQELLALFGCV